MVPDSEDTSLRMSKTHKPLAGLSGVLCGLLKAFIVVQALSIASDIWTHVTVKKTMTELQDMRKSLDALDEEMKDIVERSRVVTESAGDPADLAEAVNVAADLEDLAKSLPAEESLMATAGWLYLDFFTAIVIGLAYAAMYVITGILFLRWVYRANDNLRAFSNASLKYSASWAVWSFFVPIACLFVPRRVLSEIWAVSHMSSPGTLPSLWWLSVLASEVVGRASTAALKNSLAPDGLVSDQFFLLSLGESFLRIAVTVLTLMLVARITAAYQSNIVEKLDTTPVA